MLRHVGLGGTAQRGELAGRDRLLGRRQAARTACLDLDETKSYAKSKGIKKLVVVGSEITELDI